MTRDIKLGSTEVYGGKGTTEIKLTLYLRVESKIQKANKKAAGENPVANVTW